MATKQINPLKMRHQRLRKKVAGTPQRPRLSVHFSGQHIYAQVIDDEVGKTIAAVSTTEKEFKDDKTSRANRTTAEKVGKLVASRARSEKVTKVVFDRGGFIYHGKVKALADAAREGGLEF
ncbi:MAG: 50S ribosomal protein L18 [Chthoniobacter sp.]|nr:50S ribosomal protein L18 [Chthoniobacter sp.]